MKKLVVALLSMCLVFPQPALASELTREQWEKLRVHYGNLSKRHEIIASCTAKFLDKFSAAEVQELEQQYGSKGADAVADFCADYVKSVADGTIAYEDVHGGSTDAAK